MPEKVLAGQNTSLGYDHNTAQYIKWAWIAYEALPRVNFLALCVMVQLSLHKTDICAISLHPTKSQIGESGEIAKLSPPGERGLSNAEKKPPV